MATWVKTIINLRKFEQSGKAVSIKKYHDKVLKLSGGKITKFTEKEAKACLTNDVKTAVSENKSLAMVVKQIAQSKHKYETDDAGTLGYWLKAGVAMVKNGKTSTQYANAMKSYVNALRLTDIWLGYDIDEVESYLPAGLRLINEAKLATQHGQALEKLFKACAKEPSLSKWKSQFSTLSQNCAIYSKNNQMLAKDLLTIQDECKKQLKFIKEKKKTNLSWYHACKKRPPQDAKTMEKHNKAKTPSF